ncbi:MAG: hypothetical protein H6513_00505 [Acidimicrobiaceae bacterium]|nr:hypothetical protein [Ilumatobacter sp.]MCB9379150.1 hypothetical protein [Acidimicrobiaceae bacterium]MCO5330559.1 hypothetical protein [Ilumatobacteraceae bacterium]
MSEDHTAPMPGEAPEVAVTDVAGPAAPQSRRRGALIATCIAAVAVCALGVAVFLVGRGDDGSGAEVRGFSLPAAAEASRAATSVAYEMDVWSDDLAAVHVVGRIDAAADLASMTVDMPGIGTVEMILDARPTIVYLSASSLGPTLDAPTPWISVDISVAPGMAEAFAGGLVNPLEKAMVLLEPSNEVVDLGQEDFRGEQVRHYQVTSSLSAALRFNPALQSELDRLGGELPEQVVYHVYVTRDSQVRRLSYEVSTSAGTTSADMVYTAMNAADPIVVPAADEVTDMTDVFASVTSDD